MKVNIFLDIPDTLLIEEGDPWPPSREVFLKLTEMSRPISVEKLG